MTYKIERPAGRTVGRVPGSADSDSNQGELELRNNTPTRALTAPSKIRRVLSALADGQSMNRFQAERQLRDHCLNSTISEIQRRLDIRIDRSVEVVSGFEGTPTRCCRYRLSEEMRFKARRILDCGLR